jgi:hypothetical protein
MIGVIVALGPKANAEDTVKSDKKTVFLYLLKIKSLISEWTIEGIVVESQVMSTC